MHPVLFELGPFTIYTYGVLAAAGVLIGLWYARRPARRAGLDADDPDFVEHPRLAGKKSRYGPKGLWPMTCALD